ncbi:MAG TPA: hypothetical protein VKA38_07055, partial [Draconibacterium sp.]|nr:hypothetical protein [Draconibacterium sp.]
ETSHNEETELKNSILSEKEISAEKDMFGYFDAAGKVPGDLEEQLFAHLKKSTKKRKTIKMRIYSIASAAAVIIILLGVYIDIKETRKAKMENDFFVMEQALYQVSESIQPEKQEDLLVLWVDNDVEIIIN